tara:strand:- start:190 stop:1254 length:1065 start_codon:yes stop_codon:yes gene_type:complete
MNYFKKKAFKILKNINPDILLTINDRSYTYTEGSFLWAAKKLEIPIIITFAAQFNTSNAEIYRRDEEGNPLPSFSSNSHLSIYKLIARRVLKNQIINNIFNQNVFTLMSAKSTGIISKNSWWPGCGICDAVLVDSLYRKNLYIDNKVDESKIFIVGHPDYDLIFNSLKKRNIIREKLSKEFPINIFAPYIVFAVPQYYEQGDMSIKEHWELIESYIKSIKILKVNLLLSLHPRMIYEDYKFLEEKYECIIVNQNLSNFIGCADIFIATSSTTLSWSVLCDIPTIAVYGKSYYYEHLKSIYSEFDSNKLPDLIKKILKNNKSCNNEDFLKLSRNEVFFGKSLDLHYKIFKNQIKN